VSEYRQLVKSVSFVMTCLSAFFLTACSSSDRGVDGQDETQDNMRPSLISDLTAVEMTPTGVRLQWSAPGDDGDSGTAAAYDLRYLQTEIDTVNWDSAVAVPGLPTPSASGTLDSVAVTGLLEDSTYYFAIRTADEAGNWSNLSNVVQAVCFDDYAVTFADTAFESVIRFYVQKDSGDVLRSDMLALGWINAQNRVNIRDLSGIEHCRNLRSLQLWNNHVTDLAPLTTLNQLRVLKVGFNGLSDIGPLATLVDLDTLQLNANSIEDISALSGMNKLTELVLTSNAIWNVAPLAGKTTIRHLALESNQIVFTNPLYNLTGLEKLRLSHNQIDDLLPLGYNLGLAAGDTLWLTDNPLSAGSTDSLLAVLRDRGVTVIE
jgi:Leucine-rich repeat (LRR) protein